MDAKRNRVPENLLPGPQVSHSASLIQSWNLEISGIIFCVKVKFAPCLWCLASLLHFKCTEYDWVYMVYIIGKLYTNNSLKLIDKFICIRFPYTLIDWLAPSHCDHDWILLVIYCYADCTYFSDAIEFQTYIFLYNSCRKILCLKMKKIVLSKSNII